MTLSPLYFTIYVLLTLDSYFHALKTGDTANGHVRRINTHHFITSKHITAARGLCEPITPTKTNDVTTHSKDVVTNNV